MVWVTIKPIWVMVGDALNPKPAPGGPTTGPPRVPTSPATAARPTPKPARNGIKRLIWVMGVTRWVMADSETITQKKRA